ncbi:FAD binding domain-containing protein [Lasiosphaeris hirsuta]|uniref:FAD binding domain-containing protein n=1 Tax=Lasiosphaeris hirsuta TaxID=260670 RepID=A0AA40E9W9_9PEZI|nr:FAD binding domain-containing protein [Lasiosphaeris hirsuta]
MASLTAPPSLRNPTNPFSASADSQTRTAAEQALVQALTFTTPPLKLYTRASPSFPSLCRLFNAQLTPSPLLIARPQTTAQTSAVLLAARATATPLAVRAGGHDVWGRAAGMPDGLTLDLRELDGITLSADQKSAAVGGGVTSRHLVAFLEGHGLATAAGAEGGVGWTGWALWGGYGPAAAFTGLGVDVMLGATVVLGDGRVVEAEGDSELLWGVRGAGPALGVVVETRVRVVPMGRILAGFVRFAWGEVEGVLMGLQEVLDRGVPEAFCVQVRARLTAGEPDLGVSFCWPDGDFVEGRRWLEVVRGLGTVVSDNVAETTFSAFQAFLSVPAPQVNVVSRGPAISRFTPAAVAAIKDGVDRIPPTRPYLFFAHIAHGKAVQPNPGSCFATRKPHILFHVSAMNKHEPEMMGEAIEWADGFVDGLKATGEVLPPVYAAFMGNDEAVDESYGENWERLKALRREVDGGGC